ncbi:PAS domain-containing sensor histidine kinase [Pontibacter chitinilyticus]|uniref:PAS domain-containing sensor histidine kinase n=1 Tax=Pontibacter chitinilyticus TaxID=2674989 RepID=UPI00321B3B71
MKSELDFKQLFQALPGLYLVLSPELHVLAVSEAYLQATHSSREAMEGKYLLDMFPENPETTQVRSQAAVEASLRHVLNHKEPHYIAEQRYDVRNKNGTFESRYWHLSSIPVLQATGEINYIIHEVRDITSHIMAAREMKASRDSIHLLANAAGGTTWECDLANNKFTWGSSYKMLFGYSDADLEIAPQQWEALTHPDDYAHVRQTFQEVLLAQSRIFSLQYRFRKADHTYANVLSCGYVLYSEAGSPLRLVGSVMDLSRTKEYEQKVNESNERFERIAMATNDVIWDWNLRSNDIWWNEGFKTVFGYKDEEIEPTIISWEHRIHPEDYLPVKTSIEAAISTGQNIWESEYRFRCADGTYKLIHDKGYVLHDHDGTPIRMVGAMEDITEKRQHEQRLFDSLAWAKVIMESLPLMTWTARPDGATDYYNQRWYDYTGTTFDELKEWGWSTIIHPEDAAATTKAWQHAIRTGEPLLVENRWKAVSNGQYRWFLVRAVPIKDAEGNVTMWIGTHTDIEEQKQIQLALEESNQKFRFLAESIPQIIWSAEADGQHDYFNKRWTDYTGKTTEESTRMEWLELVYPDDQQGMLERWQYSLRTGAFYETEFRLMNGFTGTYRWFLGQAMPMRNDSGEIVKWFGSSTDIEDHKRAEEELVEKNLELQRINQDLDSFVYTASHDLKLPIINMGGIFEELMRTASFADPEATGMIRMFNKSLQQLHITINELSEVVKVQKTSGRAIEQLSLQEITDDVLLSVQDSIHNAGARISIDFSEAPAVPFTRASLKSVLYNLICNAIKYKSPDRTPEIHLSSVQKGEYIELKVTDNGLGIDMSKHQNKLFQMFKRFHNHVNGSGLGLYIVNRLLTNHNGYINIESTLNEGTTFYLYFKQKKAEPAKRT